MGRSIGRWCRLLIGLMPVALLLVACSGTVGDVGGAEPQGEPAAFPITLNVDMTDGEIQPAAIRIPVGQRVQLVLRNRSATEHHFRVQGLVPRDLLWISDPGGDRVEDVSDDEHAQHHAGGFVPWRAPSPVGIKPTGAEVHAYASSVAGPMDVVLFTAANKGTFVVQCPLHPEITGKLIVS